MFNTQKVLSKTCFTVVTRTSREIVDAVNAFKAFFKVCGKSKVRVEVFLSGRAYRTLIEVSSPIQEAEMCSRLMQAVLNAELGDAAEVIKVGCEGTHPLESRRPS